MTTEAKDPYPPIPLDIHSLGTPERYWAEEAKKHEDSCPICFRYTHKVHHSIYGYRRHNWHLLLKHLQAKHYYCMLQTVPCQICGEPTMMLGTELCDRCWELETRIMDPEIARKILASLEGKDDSVRIAIPSA